MTRFESSLEMQQARTVLISAQIHPDFEGPNVMLAACVLMQDAFVGQPLPADFVVLDVAAKQDSSRRKAYDASLRRHMVAHLTQGKRLPSVGEVAAQTMSSAKAIALLEKLIRAISPSSEGFGELFVCAPNGAVLALEILFNTYVHQLRNELSALEAICPLGYVYTCDPPSIFAREIGATILNRLQFAALKHLALQSTFSNMRAFAFNDYNDGDAVALVKAALSRHQSQVQVVPKSSLFKGPKCTYGALPGTEGALLVIHNNSDGFGQNIETEWESSSLDGAVGSNSSAAASLHRARPDLVAHLM